MRKVLLPHPRSVNSFSVSRIGYLANGWNGGILPCAQLEGGYWCLHMALAWPQLQPSMTSQAMGEQSRTVQNTSCFHPVALHSQHSEIWPVLQKCVSNRHHLVTYLAQADKSDSPSPPISLLPIHLSSTHHMHKLHLLPPQLCFSTKLNFRTGHTAVLVHEASYKEMQATSLRTMKPWFLFRRAEQARNWSLFWLAL